MTKFDKIASLTDGAVRLTLRVDCTCKWALDGSHGAVILEMGKGSDIQIARRCDLLDLDGVGWVKLELVSVCALLLASLEVFLVLGELISSNNLKENNRYV